MQESREAVLKSEEVINNFISGIVDQVTNKIFGETLHLVGKFANTFVVNPLMNQIFEAILDGEKPEQPGTLTETFDEIANAYETLGLEPGATPEQIRAAYRNLISKAHPVSQEGRKDPQANEKSCKINAAFQLLNKQSSEVNEDFAHVSDESNTPERLKLLKTKLILQILSGHQVQLQQKPTIGNPRKSQLLLKEKTRE